MRLRYGMAAGTEQGDEYTGVNMKPNRFERNYRDTVPIKGVRTKEFSNDTKLSKCSGKISLNCDHCYIPYETYACWAKRTANHYCSRACAGAAKEIKEKALCVICGYEFERIPSEGTKSGRKSAKIVTCSEKCMKEKRSIFTSNEAKHKETSSFFLFGKARHGTEISLTLTEKDVLDIRVDDRPQSVIASQYGISQSNVSQIKRGLTWKSLNKNTDIQG